jgi:beta-lactamase regulating signal transducer with metallopeptidase domain
MTEAQNLLAWMAQTIALASAAAILPILFRLQHPRTQLAYCHLALTACLLLPWVQPWRHPRLDAGPPGPAETTASRPPAAPAATPLPAELPSNSATGRSVPAASIAPSKPSHWNETGTRSMLLWIITAGGLARLCWLLGGLWQIRRYRIAALPLYPIPESVRAASAIVHADALFCVSVEVPGPVMLGWLAPVVLLPESFLNLDEEAQCGIACHELLHVRRSDWLVTLCEEIAAALLWFNPSAWVLLAQARLAREQLVDAETVRLTAAREPYIHALLAIARGRTLDLAPAPVFLRRRHLTRRMHSLLKEVSMSKTRLLSSYGSMAAILAFACWTACFSFPLTGLPQAVAAVADSAPSHIAVVMPPAQAPAAAPARIAPEAAAQKDRKPLLLAP